MSAPYTSHPYAYLKMNNDTERKCPFVVVPDGCTIYTDRPVSCRYYPVGQGTLKKRDNEGKIVHEEFYFFVKEAHCKGYEEQTQWTIGSWKDDQEITVYDSMNREWKELLMRRNLPNQPMLDDKKRMLFFMASYDLDKFRRFVLDSRFLDIFELPGEEAEEIKTSEEALMKLSFKYLKFMLGMEQALNVKREFIKGKDKPADPATEKKD